ncbi:MAG: ferritin-like domain-containing protein [Ardenticatenaceae bacterium]|nr:ferritin-like domain-containing protein [Ardenticatenaceae bacterium]
MDLTSLHTVYVHHLKDLYSAEKQIIEAAPAMIDAASSQEVKDAFADHLEESKSHLERVHALLQALEVNPGNTKCEAMEGIIKEGSNVVNSTGDADVKDVALIAAAQRVEHYEITGYGTARAFAATLGYSEAASELQLILNDEYDADGRLDKIAEGGLLKMGLNQEAVSS